MTAMIFASFVMGQVPNNTALTEKKAAPKATTESSPNAAHEMTAADVETFLDGIVPLQLRQDDIAGVTISVVRDGKLLFAKRYVYAYVEKKKPVSAQETL